MAKQKVFVCTRGKTCRKRGAKDVYCALEKQIEKLGLADEIKLKKTDCMGTCGKGPTIKVKRKLLYGGVSPADCREIIGSILRRSPVDRLRLKKA